MDFILHKQMTICNKLHVTLYQWREYFHTLSNIKEGRHDPVEGLRSAESLGDNILTFYEISFQTIMRYYFMLFSFLNCFLHCLLKQAIEKTSELEREDNQWRLDLLIMRTNLR